MTQKIKWSIEMTPEEFAGAAEPYFKKNIISLHEGICLVAYVDPESKQTPVGEGYEIWSEDNQTEPFDYTRRPYEVALRAINGEEPNLPLKTREHSLQDKNSKNIKLNRRTFVQWAIDRWPGSTSASGLQLAENLRLERKKNSKSSIYHLRPRPHSSTSTSGRRSSS